MYEDRDPAGKQHDRAVRRAILATPMGGKWLGMSMAGGTVPTGAPHRLSWAETVAVRAGRREQAPPPPEELLTAWFGPKRTSRSAPIDWSADEPDVAEPDLG